MYGRLILTWMNFVFNSSGIELTTSLSIQSILSASLTLSIASNLPLLINLYAYGGAGNFYAGFTKQQITCLSLLIF